MRSTVLGEDGTALLSNGGLQSSDWTAAQ